MTSESSNQRVGEINGPYARLFKIALCAFPIAMGWMGWVTITLNTMATRTSILEERMRGLPPGWLVERLDRLEQKVDALERPRP